MWQRVVRMARPRRRDATSLLLLLLAGMGSARAQSAWPVPDVVVFCEPTLKHSIEDVSALWRRQGGPPVRVFTAPTALLIEEIGHRIRSDVIVGQGEESAATAVQRALIKPDTQSGGWRNRLVVAVPRQSGTASGGASAALAGDVPTALVDSAVDPAGADTHQALDTLGVSARLAAHAQGVVGTADAAFLLANGKVGRAVVYMTDVAADPSLASAGLLPDESYPPVRYWIAETSVALSPNTAAFLAFLQKPETKQKLRDDGLEVMP